MSGTQHIPAASRRDLLKAVAGIGAAAMVGTTAVTALAGTAHAAPSAAGHPGMLHTQADFDRMAAAVNAGTQPWKAGWDVLIGNSHSLPTWTANPQSVIYRGGGSENYGILYNDVAAAYQNALRWKIQGLTAHGDAARDILNAWSGKLTAIDGSADRFLAAGIYGYEFAQAAEIMRGYNGFDLDRFKTMMLNVFYPPSNSFLVDHNGAYISNYWASWDLCNLANVLAIGILCDDQAKIDQAVTYFKTGAGMGSVLNAIPYVYNDQGLAQWVESGRDQGHTMLGIGLMGTVCEMAWNQGIDLYGYDDNRFMKACEYVAKYNLGGSVPFTEYTWHYGAPGVWEGWQTFTAVSADSRGQYRPVWAQLYNHYGVRKGLSVPNTKAYAQLVQPEGGGGDYGSTSGGYDHLGFGTLTHTR
ncbi:alginate lyase family protein [Streptomyces sp. NPDC091212]|uniref:alginate lyase family protein n=1 Tax=Streptomyces sp. NPDC091212 TaxID=3155191 RepID=UPI00343B8A04